MSTMKNGVHIVLFRHAEKTGEKGDPGLSELGHRRAIALAPALASCFGKFDELIAAKSIEKSARPALTLEPYARSAGLEIRQEWNTYDIETLADHVRSRKDGEKILICWRHDAISDLARRLGARDVPDWPKDLYERMWLLNFTGEQTELTALRQKWAADKIEICRV